MGPIQRMDLAKDTLFGFALATVFADKMSTSTRYDLYNGDQLPAVTPEQYSSVMHVTSPFAWLTTSSEQIEREKAVQLFIFKNLNTAAQHDAFLKRFFEIMRAAAAAPHAEHRPNKCRKSE